MKIYTAKDAKVSEIKFKFDKIPLQKSAQSELLNNLDEYMTAMKATGQTETPKSVIEPKSKQPTEGKCKSIWQTHSIEEMFDFDIEDSEVAPDIKAPSRYRNIRSNKPAPPLVLDLADSDVAKRDMYEFPPTEVSYESDVEAPQETLPEEVRIKYQMCADGRVVKSGNNPIKKKAKRIKYSKLLEEFANNRRLREIIDSTYASEPAELHIIEPDETYSYTDTAIEDLKINGKIVEDDEVEPEEIFSG